MEDRGWRACFRAILHPLSSTLVFLTLQEHDEAGDGLAVIATAQGGFAARKLGEASGAGEPLDVCGGLGIATGREEAQVAVVMGQQLDREGEEAAGAEGVG